MAFLSQCAILFTVCFLGECLHIWLPLPIPSGVYGFLLLLLALLLKIVKLRQVEKVADFFVALLPLVFVPALVGLMGIEDLSLSLLLPMLVLIVISTILVMVATGRAAQAMLRKKEKRP